MIVALPGLFSYLFYMAFFFKIIDVFIQTRLTLFFTADSAFRYGFFNILKLEGYREL